MNTLWRKLESRTQDKSLILRPTDLCKSSNNAHTDKKYFRCICYCCYRLGLRNYKVTIRWFYNMAMHHLSQSDVQSEFKSLNESNHIPCFFNWLIINIRVIFKITVIIAKIERNSKSIIEVLPVVKILIPLDQNVL